MKKITQIIFSLFIVTFLIISCKKDKPVPDNTIKEEPNLSVLNIDWILFSGRIYVTNLDTKEKKYYDHFGNNKTNSNLDIFEPSTINIDNIVQNQTKWYITNQNFILNDTNKYDYTFVAESWTYSIIGLPNGSARPFTVIDLKETAMTVRIYEAYGNDGTYNYKFISHLTFIKKGSSCANCEPAAVSGYTYSGVIADYTYNTVTLIGTKWVVSKYQTGNLFTYPNDTLEFFGAANQSAATKYTINNDSIMRTYTLSSANISTGMRNIMFGDFTTIGGNYWWGQVSSTSIIAGQINNLELYDNNYGNGSGNLIIIWIKKVL